MKKKICIIAVSILIFSNAVFGNQEKRLDPVIDKFAGRLSRPEDILMEKIESMSYLIFSMNRVRTNKKNGENESVSELFSTDEAFICHPNQKKLLIESLEKAGENMENYDSLSFYSSFEQSAFYLADPRLNDPPLPMFFRQWVVCSPGKAKEYVSTLKLAYKYNSLVKVLAGDHYHRIQIPVIRVKREQISFEEIIWRGVRRILLSVFENNKNIKIGTTCLNCSEDQIEYVLLKYKEVLSKTSTGSLIEINLAKRADEIFSPNPIDTLFDPNSLTVQKKKNAVRIVKKIKTGKENQAKVIFEIAVKEISSDKSTKFKESIAFQIDSLVKTYKDTLANAIKNHNMVSISEMPYPASQCILRESLVAIDKTLLSDSSNFGR